MGNRSSFHEEFLRVQTERDGWNRRRRNHSAIACRYSGKRRRSTARKGQVGPGTTSHNGSDDITPGRDEDSGLVASRRLGRRSPGCRWDSSKDHKCNCRSKYAVYLVPLPDRRAFRWTTSRNICGFRLTHWAFATMMTTASDRSVSICDHSATVIMGGSSSISPSHRISDDRTLQGLNPPDQNTTVTLPPEILDKIPKHIVIRKGPNYF